MLLLIIVATYSKTAEPSAISDQRCATLAVTSSGIPMGESRDKGTVPP